MSRPKNPGPGKFEAARSKIEKLLSSLNLLEDRTKIWGYPADLPARARAMTYPEMWRYCVEQKLYDYRLVDHSLIQLTVEPAESYSFLEAPLAVMTFEEFVASKNDDEKAREIFELREEYELYLSSSIEEKPATPVRYDYSERTYREGVHPAGHLHFGMENQIRVCARRRMSPIAFVLFIVRQFYPRQWEALLANEEWRPIFREIREHAAPVSERYFKGNDFIELHLT